jgi:phospholipid transport system substrate-binding protein
VNRRQWHANGAKQRTEAMRLHRSKVYDPFVSFFGAVLFVAAILVTASTSAASAATDEDAGAFLISFGKRAADEINNESLSEADREQRFRELFSEVIDVPAIGRFVLGIHWRRATADQRADFLAVFEDMAVQRFLPMITRQSAEYAGKSFNIVDVRRHETNEDRVFVTSSLFREEGPPIRMIWHLREHDGQFKVLDINIEGLSMALTLRREYSSVVRRSGGVDGLVKLLREKVEAGAFKPNADGAGK